MKLVDILGEGKSEFSKLQANKKPLTVDERDECLHAKAVWHFGKNGAPSPAVWKSVNKNSTTTYITNTHRAYKTASTLKGAIKWYHDFIKDTA